MSEYQLKRGVAHLSMDDGKVNVLGTASLSTLGEQLDQAEKDEATAIVLSGREGKFCAGFNLAEIRDPEGATWRYDVSSSISCSVSSSPRSRS